MTNLLRRIEVYLRKSGTAPSRFGRDVLGDPKFVQDMRAGREPRRKTAHRIAVKLAEMEAALEARQDQPPRAAIR